MNRRVGSLLLILCCLSIAPAVSASERPAPEELPPLLGNAVFRKSDFGRYLYFAREEAEEPARSPGDRVVDPEAEWELAAAANGCCAAPAGGSAGCCATPCGCGGCADDELQRMLGCGCLAPGDLSVGGWIAQSFTWNSDDSADNFNGPVTFTDRANEYQLNQLYLFVQRHAETGGCGAALGGRVDLLYGTDARFTQAAGLDDDLVSDRASRFYKLSIPQLYAEAAVNDLSVKLGHFYTIIGYEVVTAPDNFFVTRNYLMQYAEPFTHTGVLGSYDLSPRLEFSGGLTRGWNNWEDNNDDLSFLGGINWTSYDDRTSLALAVITGDEDDSGRHNRTMYSIVARHRPCCRWTYVVQFDWGLEDNASQLASTPAGLEPQPTRGDAEWYGFNQYLLYHVNRCLSAGLRWTWFNDDDGARVGSRSVPSVTSRTLPGVLPGPPTTAGLVAAPAQYQTLIAGLSYEPPGNMLVRSELRWDWVESPGSDNRSDDGVAPFDTRIDGSQFLWATDLVVLY